MFDPDLKCGPYAGRSFQRDDEDDCVAEAGDDRYVEVLIDCLPDVLVSPSYCAELRHG